ncbi:universal stress protein [soil metagenome]
MDTVKAAGPWVVGLENDQSAALLFGAQQAVRMHTALRVVHVYSLPVPLLDEPLAADVVAHFVSEGDEKLEAARRVLAAYDGRIPLEFVLIEGVIVDVLLDQSADASGLVLGPDDIPWYDKLFLGATTQAIAKATPCPLVVVPPDSVPLGPAGVPTVLIDGRTDAAAALRFAFEAARQGSGRLHVLHVMGESVSAREVDEHIASVNEVLAGWRSEYLEVEVTTSIAMGDLGASALVASQHASMIVMGHEHRKGFPYSLSRSQALAIIKRSDCPVAIVPAALSVVDGR